MSLDDLLAAMDPVLKPGEFAFVTFPGDAYGAHRDLQPVGAFLEQEGLTLIVPWERAAEAGLNFEGRYRMLTLSVHSSLAAVGLTAAVAQSLARKGISANVIAAFYHDHIFVPAHRADEALRALEALASNRPEA